MPPEFPVHGNVYEDDLHEVENGNKTFELLWTVMLGTAAKTPEAPCRVVECSLCVVTFDRLL